MAVRFDAAADRIYNESLASGPQSSAGMTVTMWVRNDVDQNNFATPMRLYDGGGTLATFATATDGTTGIQYFTTPGSAEHTGALSTSLGTWVPVAFTRDATSGDIFAYRRVDGAAVTTVATFNLAPTDLTGTATGVCLGGRSSTDASEWFNGSVAYVRIWKSQLTQSEIEDEWRSPTPVRTSNLYENWPLSTATDLTGTVSSITLAPVAGGTLATTTGPLLPGIQRVAERGSVANTTAASSTAVDLPAAGSIEVGHYLIARLAVDNSGASGAATTVGVSDPRGNTWTVGAAANVDPGAASAGMSCFIAYCKVTSAYTNGDDITFNLGASTTAESIVIDEFSGIHATTPVAVAQTTATGTSTTPSIARTPTAAGQMVFAAVAIEGPQADTYTQDTDTTDGPWIGLTKLGGVNATADLNATIAGAYKVVTGTTAQTYNTTITSRDWAAVALVFAPAPPPVVTKDFAGNSAASSGVTGNAVVDRRLAGDSSAASGITGALAGDRSLAANSSAASGVTGSFARDAPLAGNSSGASGLTGDLTVTRATKDLAGSAGTASGATGQLSTDRPLAGISAAASGATAQLGRDRSLAGMSAAASGATGALARTQSLSGSTSAASGLTGAAATTRNLNGSASSSAALTGFHVLTRAYAGSAGSASGATGSLNVTGASAVDLAGIASTASALSGSLTVTSSLVHFAGIIAASSGTGGGLSRVRPLAGIASTSSALTGNLSTADPWQPYIAIRIGVPVFAPLLRAGQPDASDVLRSGVVQSEPRFRSGIPVLT